MRVGAGGKTRESLEAILMSSEQAVYAVFYVSTFDVWDEEIWNWQFIVKELPEYIPY